MPIVFDEILFDSSILLTEASGGNSPIAGSPAFANTTIKNPATGIHKTNINRYDAIETLNAEVVLTSDAKVAYFLNMWRGGLGSGVGFRVRVPYDYTATLEAFAVGTGAALTFPLYKTYTRPGVTARQDVRKIVKPVVVSTRETNGVVLKEPDGVTTRVITTAFKIYINGVEQTGATWKVNAYTGLVTFTVAPANGAIIAWTGEFDIPAAFVGNSFTLRKDAGSGKVSGISFREILPAELGL